MANRRGMQTQNAVASWFKENGHPYAESAGSGRPGVDVLGMPGLACEVKARRELRLNSWLRQAEGYNGIPFVVHRPDGMGLQTVHLWPCTFRLQDANWLFLTAGYGTPQIEGVGINVLA